jgi:spore maturation protein B
MQAVAALANWLLPAFVAAVPLLGLWRGVDVYDAFVSGAREGLAVAVDLLPFMVAMFTAIGLFRSSGAMAALVRALAPAVHALGVPPALVPLAIVRPLSGNAALALVIDLLKGHGPDSAVGRMASVMQGAADTTFYIVAVYFGSVGVRDSRWSLPAGLAGDLAGFLAAVWLCRMLFGSG